MKCIGTTKRLILGAGLGVSALALMTAAQDEPVKTGVTLTIDFANGFEMRYVLPEVKEDATVLDVMLAAREHERPLTFEYKGTGQGAFLQSIEGVANELSGPKSKNWLYWVNDDFAKHGMGVMEVRAGDTIKWHFGVWKDATE